MMTVSRRHREGWVLVEAIVSVGVMGTMLAVLTIAQGRFGTFNAVQLARERCVAASQAELDSIAATGDPLGPQQRAQAWGGVRTKIEQAPGEGDWAGMTRVKVTASTTVKGRDVTIALHRYLLPGKER